MLETLRSAIDAAEWERALAAALEAWREHRAPELADVVDALGARCIVASMPDDQQQQHAWWIEHAAPYEPAAVTYLAGKAHVRAYACNVTKPGIRARWGDAHPLIAALLAGSPRWFDAVWPDSHLDAIDRLAAVLAWPPDPRAAGLLAGALETAVLATWGSMLDPVCGLIADALIALADARVSPRLAALAALAAREPGDGVEILTRARHAARAARVLEAVRLPPDPDLAALGARLAPDPATPPPARAGEPTAAAIAELWAEVAAHPDELGPRLVLGDALLELGETRGELIALSCARERRDAPREERVRAVQRIEHLVEQQWGRWLGPLAPFLHRKGCQLHRGMLEVVRVGLPGSPEDGWREAAGHHELGAVHTVRPHHVSPARYALFVEGLARPPRRLGLHRPEAIEALRARTGALPIEAVYYPHTGPGRSRPLPAASLAAALAALAKLAPALEVLGLERGCPPYELDAVLPQLPRMFPGLGRIEIPKALLGGPAYAETVERYRTLPLVALV